MILLELRDGGVDEGDRCAVGQADHRIAATGRRVRVGILRLASAVVRQPQHGVGSETRHLVTEQRPAVGLDEDKPIRAVRIADQRLVCLAGHQRIVTGATNEGIQVSRCLAAPDQIIGARRARVEGLVAGPSHELHAADGATAVGDIAARAAKQGGGGAGNRFIAPATDDREGAVAANVVQVAGGRPDERVEGAAASGDCQGTAATDDRIVASCGLDAGSRGFPEEIVV